MINVSVPVLVLILGAIFYKLSKNPENKEMARIALHAGLLVSLAAFAFGLFRR